MKLRRILILPLGIAVIALLVLFGPTVANGDKASGSDKGDGDGASRLKELEEAMATLQNDHKRLADALAHQAKASPPIGSVTAFAGPLPATEAARKAWEANIGWLLCDGRMIGGPEYQELRAALGKNNLPDFRGYFLRGIDVAIDGKTTSGRDKEGIRLAGHQQSYLTALPRNPFQTGPQSDNPVYRRLDFKHEHVFVIGNGASASYFEGSIPPGNRGPKPENQYPTRKVEGNHTHTVASGGDPETRPINAAVYWIIKFK
jgi:hypothetical protein